MTRPRVYRVDAIVLRHVDLGEADRILTLFTREHGKIRAVARGVRRPSSRMSGHLDLLCRSAALLAQGQTLDTVTQAQSTHTFPRLRDDLGTLSRACYLADLVDTFIPEEVTTSEVFDLLAQALASLEEAKQPVLLLRHFELHLLSLSGYYPEIHVCVTCRRPLEPRAHTFSSEAGGIVCPSCRPGTASLSPISLPTLKTMRFLLSGTYSQARRLHLTSEVGRELERAIGAYMQYIVEREIRSASFLRRLQAWQEGGLGPEPASTGEVPNRDVV